MKFETLSIPEIRRQIAANPDHQVILFVDDERETENLADYLLEQEIVAQYLNSTIDNESQHEILERFQRCEIEVIVTTRAFEGFFPFHCFFVEPSLN